MSNRNTLWAQIFVDELARSGLEKVCIAPGSRSTPLTMAFVEHPAIQAYSHLDERSAGFFALGLAKASHKPVGLVCTSGTALANFFPAVIEAYYSHVPLLILSGDRPHELRHSGANQTIDQLKIYGDMVKWFVDVALPEAESPPVALRNLRTLAGRACACATGLPAGVVHLNFPFRKPLEPTSVHTDQVVVPVEAQARQDHKPYTQFVRPQQKPAQEDLEHIGSLVNQSPRGLIVSGAGSQNLETQDAILTFAQKTGYPVLADVLSPLRYSSTHTTTVITSYETFLPALEIDAPDLIFRIGKLPVSKALNEYLTGVDCPHYVHLSEDGVWADDAHRVTHIIESDVSMFLTALTEKMDVRQPDEWAAIWSNIDKTTRDVIERFLSEDHYFEGGIVFDTLQLLPRESILFAGNSLAIRHLDNYGLSQQKDLTVYANRGASGIDGLISTALGTGAAHPDHPLVLVIGDISFYHDMNGLLAVQRLNSPITIVLLNNNGGGIFHRLPVRNFEPAFTDWFVTPHHLDFRHSAALYGLTYVEVNSRQAFRHAFEHSVAGHLSTLIDVKTDAVIEERYRQNIHSLLEE